MIKKNETILIRLDSDKKEQFREYCESKKMTMTDMIIKQIDNLLVDVEQDKDATLLTVKKERNFYKKELDLYNQAFTNVKKALSILNKNNFNEINGLHIELFSDNFHKIEQFNSYKLIDNYHSKNKKPDFIAVSEKYNKKLLIEFKSGMLNNLSLVEHSFKYRNLCKNFKEKEEVKLVFIFLDDNLENVDVKSKVDRFTLIAGHDVIIYSIDELLNFI